MLLLLINVEIGGLHSAAASNPVISCDEFPELLEKFTAFTLLNAKMAPRLVCVPALHVLRGVSDMIDRW